MSNDMKVINDLAKLTEKEFNKRNYVVKNDFGFCYFIEDDSVKYLGLDLAKLDLDEKKMELVQESIRKLQKLKGFSIRYPKNRQFPEWFKEFKDMENLSLANNNLTVVPEWIKEFKNLIYLNLQFNDITNLPEWLISLNELKEFSIRNNYNLDWNDKNRNILKTLSEKKIRITAPRLFEFIIQHDLPQDKIEIIRELEKDNIEKEKQGRHANPIIMETEDGDVVEWRIVYYNIKNLPENFGVFDKLRSLTIINTPIEYLPNSFGNLTNLKLLDLSGNKLKSLPDSFVNLTSITNLNLSNNQFTEIPTVLWALKELTELNLSNNPLNDEEQNIIQKSPDLITDYLRKKATITIFISHAIIDFEPYRIGELVEFLKNQKEISEVYFCEDDLAGNIDEWMLDTVQKCQLLLFIATKKSVFDSVDCQNELQLADKFSIPIIPIKGDDVDWADLAEIKLSRELGLEFDKGNFNTFCDDLYRYIHNFKREIDLMSQEERRQGIIDIYERFRLMLDESLGEIKRELTSLKERISKLEK
ncbi:MAG: hypothetical protein ACFFHD_02695 [Promethearchaeota archaeon]